MKLYSNGGKFAANPKPNRNSTTNAARQEETALAESFASSHEQRIVARKAESKRRRNRNIWLTAALIFFSIIAVTLIFLLARKAKVTNDYRDLAQQIQQAEASHAATKPSEDVKEPDQVTNPGEEDSSNPVATEPVPETILPKYQALVDENPEFFGWLRLDGTILDYPVMRSFDDNDEYLYSNFDGDYCYSGVPFADFRNTRDSDNILIYGHNIRDGSMFHSLVNYGDLKGNLNYYKKHPVVEFNTPEGDQKYKIISVFKTNVLYDHGYFFNYMQGSFHSDAEFMNFVYNCRVRSLINCPVMVNEDDQLLTLSTCSYEFTNWRTVIVARKLREGENDKVNIELATRNSKPLFPEVYYSRYGGTRPKELTFKKANAKGLINWYDGSGKLEGSEVLSATLASNPTDATDESGKVISTKPKKVYQVKFLNYDGSEFHSANVLEGDSVKIPKGTPGLPKDAYYDYTFTGWNFDGLDIKNVQYNMTITPKFKATLKK